MWRAWAENHFRCVEVEDLGELSNVTIDGRHPAPVEVGSFFPLFTGFSIFQVVVWDF